MVPPFAAFVPPQGEPALLASEFEMPNAEATAWCADRVTCKVGDDPVELWARTIAERSGAKAHVGVEMKTLSVRQYARLSELLPEVSWSDESALLPNLMTIKSAAEIEPMRAAGRLSTLGMQASLDECAPGRTDNDLAAAAYNAMVRGGSEFMCVEPIVTVGNRSGIPHSTFRRTRLERGDAILVEVGGCYHRYTAPLMRTAATAPVHDEVRRAADGARDSLSTLLEQMRPGNRAGDAARRAGSAWGEICRGLIWHGIYGYSVGVGFPPDWNDAPLLITEDSNWSFKPGMCFHATTSLRRAQEFGVAFSETVLITENGNEVLTGTPRELHIV